LVNGGAAIALVSYVTNALQKTGHVPDARLPMGFFLAGLVCCAATRADSPLAFVESSQIVFFGLAFFSLL
jgi:hypothetical protein